MLTNTVYTYKIVVL